MHVALRSIPGRDHMIVLVYWDDDSSRERSTRFSLDSSAQPQLGDQATHRLLFTVNNGVATLQIDEATPLAVKLAGKPGDCDPSGALRSTHAAGREHLG